jgi:two-component system sensor histidine kinase DegS
MTTPTPGDLADGPAAILAARLEIELATLDLELAEIDMLVGQAKTEATHHEQKRVQGVERMGASDRSSDPKDLADGYGQLVALTHRAVLMKSQVDILDGKRRALARHRASIAAMVAWLRELAATPVPVPGVAGEAMTPAMSRVVLGAQEDMRREIARAMHDGPAQSLTNIVLQAQIVERLLERDPAHARGELRLLVSMVQSTLDATKNFIFDVRPMVLDDLGLVPTLRRAARDRGRRAHVPVEFESMGHDRRLPMEMESGVFRVIDEALAAYLALAPERITLRIDWSNELEARVAAFRTPLLPGGEPLPEVPTGDTPDALKQMIQDRHDALAAAIVAAKSAAVVALPAVTRREITARATAIGGTLEVLGDGGEIRLLVALPAPDAPAGEG